MKQFLHACLPAIGLFSMLCAPAHATVRITAFTPTQASPQVIGTSINWTVTATDSATTPLTFQFQVAPPGGALAMMKDFNLGLRKGRVWSPAKPFVWTPTGPEGTYQIQLTIKDFKSGQSASTTVPFTVNPLVTGSTPVVAPTANALVALFSAPACAAGSMIRVSFQESSKEKPANQTNWVACNPAHTQTFEIAGMYPSTEYQMFSQTMTGGSTVDSATLIFTTGPLPSGVPFPTFKVLTPAGKRTDTTDAVVLHSTTTLGAGTDYPDVATDLDGNIIWYYYADTVNHVNLLTRPLPNGGILSLEEDFAWTPKVSGILVLRQLDLAGNIVRETNTGIVGHQLTAKGATDTGPCSAITKPAPVGSACLGSFHHDAIQTLNNGYTAVFMDVEKIFPVGTQGDTSGLPVDVLGDMIVVLDTNWQVVWYFDTFEHAGGAPELDINRRAVLGETCVAGQGGCPRIFLLGTGIAPQATDWLHANSIYYWPAAQNGTSKGDIIWSSRHQDFIMRVSYQDATGDGAILWRLGPCGDFTFNNIYGDAWPWNSHQHDVGMENNGVGPLTIFDNGNTRVSPTSGSHMSSGCLLGLGSGCKPHECNSRGMAVTFDETTKVVTPVLSQNLDYFSTAMGSAQLLNDGKYFFLPAIVAIGVNKINSYAMEFDPKAGTDTGTKVLNIEGAELYRAWQMPDMYTPPIT